MRYPGGKGKCFQHIINLMPPHRVYIETHLGGGSVLRNKRPAERNIGVELDARVIAAWKRDSMAPDVELVHGRAEDFLVTFPFQGDELVYADPPYHPSTRRSARIYKHDYSDADHERLVGLLLTLKCKVLVSGYDNPMYDKLLGKWRKTSFRAKTHRGCRTETVWSNFPPSTALHDPRFLGATFREREATRRRLERLKHRLGRIAAHERAAIAQWLHEVYPETRGNRA